MRLKKSQQLLPSLRQELKPLVWIAGDEPLLLQESADTVRKFCREAGFDNREVFTVDRSFDWAVFSETTDSLSLFAERRLIELRLSAARLDEQARPALLSYLESPNPDYLILMTSPRIDAATQKTRWFKSIEASAWFLPVWPLALDELPDWLGQRFLRAGMRPSPEALQLLIQRIEGNLLAAVQEIEKLRLLTLPGLAEDEDSSRGGTEAGPDRTSAQNPGDSLRDGLVDLDADSVLQAVADSSRFSTFTLIDAALAGEAGRSLKILHGLRGEGIEPLAILGSACGELRRLLPAVKQVESGQLATRMAEQLVGRNFRRKMPVSRALQRLRPPQVYRLLDQARLVDYSVKGLNPGDPWLELENLFLGICGSTVPTQKRLVG